MKIREDVNLAAGILFTLFLLLVICFFSFSFAPPELPLFTPPA